ncbi:MAG: DEAD/DEAH box helicase family protein [bacterium]|nr:DEAD/DEAH box helicase family protein [bacterium]
MTPKYKEVEEKISRNVADISARMGLWGRLPQIESLHLLEQALEKLSLTKEHDLAAELAAVQEVMPGVKDFERDFPNLCFALATGVGKTRLMGAFVAYLYIFKRVRNFLILAPNLTIYRKLKEEFSNPSHPKYVLGGLSHFVQKRPRIIDGESYEQTHMNTLEDYQAGFGQANLYIFNVDKIKRDEKSGRIRRFNEYLGQDFFGYLAELEDLVVIMDESHHYRAEKSLAAINELKPILGLELTATPRVESQNRDFKNVAYQFSLKNALDMGYVKRPAVVTKGDLDPLAMTPEELDRLKLLDGIRLHRNTAAELLRYHKQTGRKLVRPFVLVVAKDTGHAAEIREYLESKDFFEGDYEGKVLEIHSAQRGSEKDENVAKLVELEHKDDVEIVVHVNMLKEGWDVTNLYTIIPLRASVSETLTQQTMGRGLRVPYGKQVGDAAVDRLAIVAHDKYQALLDAANQEDSLFKKENIIDLDLEDSTERQTLSTPSALNAALEAEEQRAEAEEDPQKRQKAISRVAVKRAFVQTLTTASRQPQVKSVQDTRRAEVKTKIQQEAKNQLTQTGQIGFMSDLSDTEVEEVYLEVVQEFEQKFIEIPRITIFPSGNIKTWFDDFDLELADYAPQPLPENLWIKYLADQETKEVLETVGGLTIDRLDRILVTTLLDVPQVEYPRDKKLLFKLAQQALIKIGLGLRESYANEQERGAAMQNVVFYYRREICNRIAEELTAHFHQEAPKQFEVQVLPFKEILPHHFTLPSDGKRVKYSQWSGSTAEMKKCLFTGFKKACHLEYVFHSRPEFRLASLMEEEAEVLKWLRPANGQFNIVWGPAKRTYVPDFVAETANMRYLIEVKRADQIATDEVQQKKDAAEAYCQQASDYAKETGRAPWKYVIIPHDKLESGAGVSFGRLVG